MFSLSLKNTGETATTGVRVNAIKYFSVTYLKSPILGLGYLDGWSGFAPGGGHIADIGALQTIFVNGLCGIVYIGSIIAVSCMKCIVVFLRKMRMNEFGFLIPLVIAFLLYNFNMDMFGGYLAYAIPFYLAFMKKHDL